MKSLPNEEQLKIGFIDFAQLSVELLGRSERDIKYLKFAVANAQIALELFLKYIYVKNGKISEIQKQKNGELQNDFVEYAQILNHYYSHKAWSYGVKREFVSLMEARNSILHKAQKTEWDTVLATSVVRTIFFIHSTWNSDFGECLFEHSYGIPNSLSNNKVWRQGVESFVEQLINVHDMEVWTCLTCKQHTVINNEFFGLLGTEGSDHLVCLNCFVSINIEHQASLIQCDQCYEKSYIIDPFNEQTLQLYVGKCSECGKDSWVRRCRYCKKFYHPNSCEVVIGENYFCSNNCAAFYAHNAV